jgi:hypothetical protein
METTPTVSMACATSSRLGSGYGRPPRPLCGLPWRHCCELATASDILTLADIACGIILTSIDKLICAIRNNPKDVRFEDACKVAEGLGFTGKGGKGSHNVFSRTGEQTGLNFQKRKGGKIPTYQGQLIDMIAKYYMDPEDYPTRGKNEDAQ